MNMSMVKPLVLGLAMALASMPLAAQSDVTVAKVETNAGVIMVSDPGEFTTATADQRVRAKARLMVSEDSAATVVYDNGCKQKYEKPGVYEISPTCMSPVAVAGGPSTGLIVGGSLLAAGAAYAIIENNNDDDDRPPVSR